MSNREDEYLNKYTILKCLLMQKVSELPLMGFYSRNVLEIQLSVVKELSPQFGDGQIAFP